MPSSEMSSNRPTNGRDVAKRRRGRPACACGTVKHSVMLTLMPLLGQASWWPRDPRASIGTLTMRFGAMRRELLALAHDLVALEADGLAADRAVDDLADALQVVVEARRACRRPASTAWGWS